MWRQVEQVKQQAERSLSGLESSQRRIERLEGDLTNTRKEMDALLRRLDDLSEKVGVLRSLDDASENVAGPSGPMGGRQKTYAALRRGGSVESTLVDAGISPELAATVLSNSRKRREEDMEATTFVKDRILEASNTRELLAYAEGLIREDWLCMIEPYSGNMYLIAAFGWFRSLDKGWEGWLQHAGFVVIFLLQVFGPPTVFGTSALGVGLGPDTERYQWEAWEPSIVDWKTIPMNKILSMLFMEAFLLNSVLAMNEDYKTWLKIIDTVSYLRCYALSSSPLRGDGWF